MTLEEYEDRLWGIYQEACICHLDYDSRCGCVANYLAGEALSDLLGANWHSIMRARHGG